MRSYLGSKGPKNHRESPKIGYFSHILGIRAISPIHWIKCLIGTYMIECPKDKVIIHRASGVGYRVFSGLQRAQKSSKNHRKFAIFSHILGTRASGPNGHGSIDFDPTILRTLCISETRLFFLAPWLSQIKYRGENKGINWLFYKMYISSAKASDKKIWRILMYLP